MSTEIQRTEPGKFSPEQVELIKVQLMPASTDGELNLFLATCERLRLDPFAKQIYAIKRWDPQVSAERWVTQTSIDGHRVVAGRHAAYQGQTPPQWCGPDLVWRDVWLNERQPPSAARVGVWKEGFREPVMGVARYASYVQVTKSGEPIRNWRLMPDVMLAKCAEALALRKAFPNDLSGIYTIDERPIDMVETEPGKYAPAGPLPRDPEADKPPRPPTQRPQTPPPREVIDVDAEIVKTKAAEPSAWELTKQWTNRINDCATLEQLEALKPDLRALPKNNVRTVLIHAYQAQEEYLKNPPPDGDREPGQEG